MNMNQKRNIFILNKLNNKYHRMMISNSMNEMQNKRNFSKDYYNTLKVSKNAN